MQLIADEVAPAVGSKALVVLGSHGGRLHVLGHRVMSTRMWWSGSTGWR